MEEMTALDDTTGENETPIATQIELEPIATEPPRSKNPWKLISVLLVVALIATNSLWFSTKLNDDQDLSEANATADQLESDLNEACEVNDDLESALTSLEAEYYTLLQEYPYLQLDIQQLTEDYEDLELDYERLSEDYDDLESEYASLSEEYQLYEMLSLESLASDYYESVREMREPYIVTLQDLVDFWADLSKHNQAEIYWSSLEDAYYEEYRSHSYDDALATLDFVLEYSGISWYDSDVVKLTKILAFINEFIVYRPDMDDRALAPIETLAYRSGDCEDFSILASALFELAGIDSALGYFTDSAGIRGDHAMVLIHLDDLGGYGYWYYSDLTGLGLSSGEWIKIEPQWSIEEQSSEEISEWDLEVAADT